MVRNGLNEWAPYLHLKSSVCGLPVVMRADLMDDGLQCGCIAFTRAAAPATWGQDIEVPEIILYLKDRLSNRSPDGGDTGDQAAKMSTPGAVTSGCNSL